MLYFFIFCFLVACSNVKTKPEVIQSKYAEITDFKPADTLFLLSDGLYELGKTFCYVNQKGDTIIPAGRFESSFSDTILTFGIVIEKIGENSDLIGINQQGQRLYEVQRYDNGPDYLEDGLFRILRYGKTGYADATGKIVIPAKFDCAFPFVDGQAKVSNDCEKIKDHEYTAMNSEHWIYIDQKGEKIER